MRRFQSFWALARNFLAVSLLLLGLPAGAPGLAAGSARADAPLEGPAELPDFVGTWHVLIHYRVPGGPHPERWKWDERVWVIEPSGDGFEWVEHAIVSFQDPSGRFEHLGTNRARRLIGAWQPNESQQQEIAAGLAVSGRGMRSKHIREVRPGVWRSDGDDHAIGQSSSGLGYSEVWSIQQDGEITQFSIETRFAVSTAIREQSGGATLYRGHRIAADPVDPPAADARYRGDFARSDEQLGRFRMSRTQILIPEAEDPTDTTARPRARSRGLIQLIPDRNVNANVPLLFSVLRPFHYYADRRLVVHSTPPGAELDVAYLRRGSQLLYRRGRAPLEIVLPTRLQSAASDRLLIRGFLPGHERTRLSLAVDEADATLQLELPPLPNQLLAVAHGSLAGRTVLELRSQELPTLRVAHDESGWTLVLVRTGLRPALSQQIAALRDPALSFLGRQLGNDFVLRIEATAPGDLELRHSHVKDPSRDETRIRIEIGARGAAGRSARLLRAVDALNDSAADACGAPYEEALRARLARGPRTAPLGRDDHPYRATLRAALRQLAASRDGRLQTRSGDALGTTTPLEFELAWSRSDDILGYLVWLQTLARRIDPGDDGALAFRSLVAPEWRPDEFGEALDSAAAARERCRAGASHSPAS